MFHPAQPYPVDARPTGPRALMDVGAINGDVKAGPRRFWTTTEVRILHATYPTGGLEGCVAALPGRSASSIYQRAGREGLRKRNASGGVTERRVWPTTPQIDAAITRVYSGAPSNGAVKKLALTLGRPRGWICNRARALGLVVPRFKEAPWSEAEIEIVRAHGGKHPDVVRRIMKKAGFTRTATAIKLKTKRLHIAREVDENLYTARGLGIALGIDSGMISSWIARGWLKARRKPVPKGCDPEKGNWVIARRDVRNFVIDNVAVVDFRKVDKFWLVDLLAGKGEA